MSVDWFFITTVKNRCNDCKCRQNSRAIEKNFELLAKSQALFPTLTFQNVTILGDNTAFFFWGFFLGLIDSFSFKVACLKSLGSGENKKHLWWVLLDVMWDAVPGNTPFISFPFVGSPVSSNTPFPDQCSGVGRLRIIRKSWRTSSEVSNSLLLSWLPNLRQSSCWYQISKSQIHNYLIFWRQSLFQNLIPTLGFQHPQWYWSTVRHSTSKHLYSIEKPCLRGVIPDKLSKGSFHHNWLQVKKTRIIWTYFVKLLGVRERLLHCRRKRIKTHLHTNQ